MPFLIGIRRILGVFAALCVVAPAAFGQASLDSGNPVVVPMTPGNVYAFSLDLQDWHGEFSLDAGGTPRVAMSMRARFGTPPTATVYDHAHLNTQRVSGSHGFWTRPEARTGRYYIHFEVTAPTTVTVVGKKTRKPAPFTTLGANPTTTGTGFRVWAPFASKVAIAGQFNSWRTDVDLLPEANGNWSLAYRNARPGQQYKYVISYGLQTLWRVDPRAKQVTASNGNGVIVDPAFTWNTSGYSTPSWNDMVIYEMHMGTFNDAPGGVPGNFNSAIARLDHIRDTGFNCIKLMPINEFPGDFSWGYNASHPFSVESAYGGPFFLKKFVEACHQRGIAVILDIVHNHYGPNDLSLWQFDGWSQNNRGGIYFYNDDRANTPWGDTRPDFGRGEVRQYIRDSVLMWLNEYRIDGIRWDSVLYTRTTDWGENPDGWSLMQWINDDVRTSQPWKIMIGEDLQGNSWITKPTSEGGAGFNSQWSAGFVHPIRAAIEAPNDSDRNIFSVKSSIEERFNGDAFQRVIYTESHDEVANGRQRVPETIWPGNAGSYYSRKRSTLGAALVMTAPGIPMVFQGQEFLEDGWFADSDPLDWSKLQTFAGIHLMYRDLVRLRRNSSGVTAGLKGQNLNVFHTNNIDKVIAFHRWSSGGPGDDVVVVANFSNQTRTNYEIGLPRSGRWVVRFNSDWNGYSPDFSNLFSPDFDTEPNSLHGLSQRGRVNLAPYSVLVLSQ